MTLERNLDRALGDPARRDRFLESMRRRIAEEVAAGTAATAAPRRAGPRAFLAAAAALLLLALAGARSIDRPIEEPALAIVAEEGTSYRDGAGGAVRLDRGRLALCVPDGRAAVIEVGDDRVRFGPGIGWIETREGGGGVKHAIFGMVIGTAALVGGARADDGVPAPDEAVRTLVALLGAEEWSVRDEASRRLEEMGPAALERLAQASRSADPEVRSRAVAIVSRIERRGAVSERDVLLARARELQDQGQLHQALEAFDSVIRIEPRQADILLARAALLGRVGDADRALRDLDMALSLEPGTARVHVARGNFRVTRGDTAAALADFTRAIELDPKASDALLARARARILLGDLEAARVDAARAVELVGPAAPRNVDSPSLEELRQILQALDERK